MTVQPASLEAYALVDTATMNMKILALLDNHVGAMTDRAIMHWLGFSDPNKVRPRITWLCQRQWINNDGRVKDPESNVLVRECTITQAGREALGYMKREAERHGD